MPVASTIGDLGEFGLIARVTARFPETDDVILGPGDDAAVVGAPDRRVVATMDVLVEGAHFRRDWSAARDVGHKAVAQNCADVEAMGARPTALLIGLAVPGDLPVAWVDGFTEGVRAECAAAGAAVVGGDTVRSERIAVSVTALGSLDGGRAVTRSGARAGDSVAVTGPLGLSAAGMELLASGVEEEAVEKAGARAALDEHRRPGPPYGAGPRAARAGATAMLDVSDGLLQDLGHIAEASGVAVDVRRSALAPPPGLAEAAALLAGYGHRREAADYMLAGGEDHALAAAFPPGAVPAGWAVIGEIREGRGVTVDGRAPAPSGWDHFG
ncbi:thiamine-phosphate kinase [Nocardiopsis composta]